MSGPRILVRGGGVAGLVTAVVLAESGASVTLTERAAQIGAGASWKAGGMLAPWCESETAPHEILDHAEATIAWWLSHAPDAVRRGSLVLAPSRDGGELTRLARRTGGHETCDGDAIAALEPDLAGRFATGLFFPREAHLDPRLALPALAARLASHGGLVLLEADAIPEGVDRIVDCRGFAARGGGGLNGAGPGFSGPGSADQAGCNLRGVRGEMLLLRCPELSLSRPLRLLHPRTPVYVVPRADHVFMLGATMVESEQLGGVTARAMLELLGAAYTLHPAFAEAEIIETGVGLRPSYPDNMPRVVLQPDGVISVNGMHRHGFLLAPVLAARVVELLGKSQGSALHPLKAQP